jgi:glycosyltransferase involved in cell wall biosynthesis
MRVAVLFDNLGPYHIARLTQLSSLCDLLVVEQNVTSTEYAWTSTEIVPFRRVTLFRPEAEGGRRSARAVRRGIHSALSAFHPEVVVVPGWASRQSLAAVIWARGHRVPVIVMSDSQEIDFVRRPFSEWVKRVFLSCCSGALVAGNTHLDYVVKLGMDVDHVRLGYDVVDNIYFSQGAKRTRHEANSLRAAHNLPSRYFLSIARFVEKKNIETLILAFSKFLCTIGSEKLVLEEWHLIVLGDGPLRVDLEKQIEYLGLRDRVFLLGFKQYYELPIYYGLAEAFILSSTTEQWGLVVNEAMASGLPVLVSNRCGASKDLVKIGINGYTFDPLDGVELTRLMVLLAEDESRRKHFGIASAHLVDDWSPTRFAANLMALVSLVTALPKRRASPIANFLLRAMLYRPS